MPRPGSPRRLMVSVGGRWGWMHETAPRRWNVTLREEQATTLPLAEARAVAKWLKAEHDLRVRLEVKR
jgi:hypothetical protein